MGSPALWTDRSRNQVAHILEVAPALILFAAATWGCAQPEHRTAPVVETFEEDGATVVFNREPEFPPGSWSLAPEPYLEIGKVEGEEPYVFETIGDAHTLETGVSSCWTPTLLRYGYSPRKGSTCGRPVEPARVRVNSRGPGTESGFRETRSS